MFSRPIYGRVDTETLTCLILMPSSLHGGLEGSWVEWFLCQQLTLIIEGSEVAAPVASGSTCVSEILHGMDSHIRDLKYML